LGRAYQSVGRSVGRRHSPAQSAPLTEKKKMATTAAVATLLGFSKMLPPLAPPLTPPPSSSTSTSTSCPTLGGGGGGGDGGGLYRHLVWPDDADGRTFSAICELGPGAGYGVIGAPMGSGRTCEFRARARALWPFARISRRTAMSRHRLVCVSRSCAAE
jgi:hypothetical protein